MSLMMIIVAYVDDMDKAIPQEVPEDAEERLGASPS